MYSKLISCVRLYGNYINISTCNVGLMQRESLFPVLYSFYVNDIEFEKRNHGCQSYELKALNLLLLIYADYAVVFSENVEYLQNIIDSVYNIAKETTI